MPFTFCHPAIVLPFSYRQKRISMVGLIVGSMIPDFEYFIRMKVVSMHSHTWPGIFWFDLPLGLMVVFIYQLVVRDRLINNLPTALNRRFSQYKSASGRSYSIKYAILVAVCILIGAASHILWDGFTHPTGNFVLLVPALSDTIYLFNHHVFIYKILQHGSSIVGAVVIIITIYSLPLHDLTKKENIAGYWTMVLVVVFITLVIRLFTGLSFNRYGDIIVTEITGLFLGLIAASAFITKKTRVV
jgi:hypothetical protein